MKYIKIIGSVFILFCLALTGVLIWILPDKIESENENRILAGKPELNAQKIISTEYQSNLNNYLSDQFPARDCFMMVGTELKFLSGKRDFSNTYIGKDNYFFEKVLDSNIDENRFKNNLSAVDNLAKKNPDINFTNILIPSSGTILKEKLPPFAEMYDFQKLYSTAESELEYCKTVNIYSALRQHKKEYIYYRTDHHWTTFGAYIGYTAYTGNKDQLKQTKATDSFCGTLHSKTLKLNVQPDIIYLPEIPDSLKITANGKQIEVFDRSALNKKDKYKVFFGGNYGIVDITGGNGTGTLLVIKDSFANCFVPFLTNDYERIIMIDMRYYGGSVSTLMKNEKIDEVLVLYEMNNFAGDTSIAKLAM